MNTLKSAHLVSPSTHQPAPGTGYLILRLVAFIAIAAFFLLTAPAASAQQIEIPIGDYVVLSENETHTEFILAFVNDYRWKVRALCMDETLPAPAVSSICTYNGSIFTCPGAQNLSLMAVIEQPPPPTPTPTPTFTPTFTPTYTPTFTPIPTSTPTLTATSLPSTTPTPTLASSRTPTSPTQQISTGTPVLPGAPASEELLATISAANRPFEQPRQNGLHSILAWLRGIWLRFCSLFGG